MKPYTPEEIENIDKVIDGLWERNKARKETLKQIGELWKNKPSKWVESMYELLEEWN